MTRICLCCAASGRPCRIEEDDCPVVVKITVGVARPDLSAEQREAALADLPGWVRAILAMPEPAVLLCARCASHLLSAEAALTEHVLEHVPERARRLLFPDAAEPNVVSATDSEQAIHGGQVADSAT